jgi:pimeloyl-ACP methyl ester carboxylesterase
MIARRFLERLDRYEGWDKYNVHHWNADLADFAEFFFSQCFSEPHSTKPREDCVGWAMETNANILRAESATDSIDRDVVLEWCRGVDTPVLVIHGSDDRVSPVSRGEALAKATGGDLVILSDSGHVPLARDPVKVNRLIENFVREIASRSEARA